MESWNSGLFENALWAEPSKEYLAAALSDIDARWRAHTKEYDRVDSRKPDIEGDEIDRFFFTHHT